jgi:glucose/mannose-6-phosphate isomerase
MRDFLLYLRVMEELLRRWPEQLKEDLGVEFGERRRAASEVVVCGMGGSALAAEFLRSGGVGWPISINRDYGWPRPPAKLADALLVLSSYSGNTEEVLDVARLAAAEGNLNVAVISAGGQLLELARGERWPHVVLPEGWPPRLALGYFLQALALLVGDRALLAGLGVVSLSTSRAADEAANLVEALGNRVPVIYSSSRNLAAAYHWKIEFNETGKLPAFYNVLPELNHNELSGLDPQSPVADFARRLHFIFLTDEGDHPRVKRRFQALGELFSRRHLAVSRVNLSGAGRWEQLLQNYLVSVWTAFYLARRAGVDPVSVPMIEDFKKLIG